MSMAEQVNTTEPAAAEHHEPVGERTRKLASRAKVALRRPAIGASVAGAAVLAAGAIWGVTEALVAGAAAYGVFRALKKGAAREREAQPAST